jgi:hypothetical protein
MYFHHGFNTSSFYVWWTPDAVTSPYYGGFAAASTLSGGAYIAALDDGTTNYAGYAVYGSDNKPMRLALVNSDYYDGTGFRGSHNFSISGLSKGNTVTAKRLTAAHALVRQDEGGVVTYGGQIFGNASCGAQGRPVTEETRVTSDTTTFVLAASEAVIIELHQTYR